MTTRTTSLDGRLRALTLVGFVAAVGIRLVLLPTEGYRGDLDQFVKWVHDIAAAPLGQAYRLALGFLVSVLLVTRGHVDLAAVVLGVALMTKPQAAFFVVPIAAWLLGATGWRSTFRFGLIALATVAILWLPFVPGGGIQGYVRNLDAYGNQTFSIASLRAWNAWWIMQEASGGQFLADTATLFGPITGRTMAFALAALGELVVFLAVLQSPTRRNLALGVATSVLVCFSLLTAMHERYAFGALVFLTLGFAEPRIRAIWLVFNVVFMANLLAATPASTAIADILPEGGPVSIVGSLAI